MASELAVKVAEALERSRWRRSHAIVSGIRKAVSPTTGQIADIIDAAGVAELVADNDRLRKEVDRLRTKATHLRIELWEERNRE